MLKEQGNILSEQIPITKSLLDFCKLNGFFISLKSGDYSNSPIKTNRSEKYNGDLIFQVHTLYQAGKCCLEVYFDVFGLRRGSYFVKDIFPRFDLAIISKAEYRKMYDEEFKALRLQAQAKQRQTCLERYGVPHATQSKEIRDKTKQTSLERYGVDNPSKAKEVKEKIKQVHLERYGVPYATQAKEVKEKTKRTNLERYGVPHNWSHGKLREKLEAKWIAEYGVDNPIKSKQVRAKIQATSLEKYGAKTPFASLEIQDKIEQTNLEKYGAKSPAGSKSVREKIEQTNLEKYGAKTPLESQEVRDKIQATSLERYGAKTPLEASVIREKIERTNLAKYGAKTPFESLEIQERVGGEFLKKYGAKTPFGSPEIRIKAIYKRNQRFPVASKFSLDFLTKRFETLSKFKANPGKFSPCKIQDFLQANYNQQRKASLEIELGIRDPYKSSLEVKVCNFLDSLGIEYETNNRKILGGLELDIWIPDHKVAIEINGLYWHSSVFKDQFYHQNKKKGALKLGISLMMFTEDQIKDQFDVVCSIIRHRLGLTENKIQARKCQVREISFAEARKFLEGNHLDKAGSGSKFHYGLEFNGELVQVITVGPLRFGQKRIGFELIRSATKLNTLVSGGFQKLIKFFKSTKEFNKISSNPSYAGFESYVDANVFDGASYGGSDEMTAPDLWFVVGDKRFKRQKFMKHNLHKLFPEFPQRGSLGYDEITVSKFLKEKDVQTYHGCGNFKFLL